MQSFHRSLGILALAWVAFGCDGSSPTPDAADDASGEIRDDAGADGDADADGDPDGDADADGDPDGDADACVGSGALGDDCADHCDCSAGLRCLGFPGATVCSTPCTTDAACADAVPDCTNPFCELGLGACGCRCLGPEDCPGEQCALSYCVGCASDEHCAGTTCPSGTPRCRPDTASCVCAGACGDGTCDELEAATLGCPADCPGPCIEGESQPWSCWDGSLVPWCRCESGAWVCETDPVATCPGDTECQRTGGGCVADAASCYEGTVHPEPLGCSGDAPVCCRNEVCVGPGGTYYPTGAGACCPGLLALSSVAPMAGMLPDPTQIACFASCWVLTCTPCGDGTCEPHLGENFCNCPRDCPTPDYLLGCSMGDSDCGLPFCRMEGDVCHQETPRCSAGSCTRETEDFPGRRCDCATRSCVAG